jgi:uncharacterized membrane protein
MVAFTIVVQWLHVLLGIFWFGSALYLDFIFVPVLINLPIETQQQIGGRLAMRSDRIITAVSILVILLGFVRGTLLGELHSVQAVLGTAYGVTWLIALLVALALFTYGQIVLRPTLQRLNKAPSPAEFSAIVERIRVLVLLELLFFVVIFTCMILMRFGM